MKKLPRSKQTLLVRTCFDDAAAWEAICDEVRRPTGEYAEAFAVFAAVNAMFGQDMGAAPGANVKIIDDVAFDGLTAEQLMERLRPDSAHVILLIADRESMTTPEHAVLVVDVFVQKGRRFRALPARVSEIESNLSIANCDWEDFAGGVGKDGAYRGHGG
jgi:hypothetical protein